MSKEITGLLSVLDMSEEEQCKALVNEGVLSTRWAEDWQWSWKSDPTELDEQILEYRRELADLAFRLRDEVVKTCRYKYDDAIIQVYSVSKESAEKFHWWWIRHSQPIHIIIAALIAKELAKETSNEQAM